MARSFSWSYSRASCFKKCRLKYKLAYIDKIKQPPNRAMERGIDIHNKGEQFLLGNIRGVPNEYKRFNYELRALKKYKAKAEEEWAITEKWKRCQWRSNVAWCRSKTDAHLYTPEEKDLLVIDFKTGRMYPDHKSQAEIYSLKGLLFYPEAETVTTEFWYLDKDDMQCWTYGRELVTPAKRKWTRLANEMKKEKAFTPNPGDHCGYCPFSRKKGGPCRYS